MKEHKGKLILTSLLVLLPLVAGLLLWNRLPAQLPMHWNAAGEIDGWGSRLMVVCAEPLFLLVIHWVCVVACFIDPKNKGQNRKALGLVLWICPAVSLLAGFMTLSAALGVELRRHPPLCLPALGGLRCGDPAAGLPALGRGQPVDQPGIDSGSKPGFGAVLLRFL